MGPDRYGLYPLQRSPTSVALPALYPVTSRQAECVYITNRKVVDWNGLDIGSPKLDSEGVLERLQTSGIYHEGMMGFRVNVMCQDCL